MDFAKKRVWGPTPNYPLVESYVPPHGNFTVIAGPCSVEDPKQIVDLARIVRNAGATHLRGGVFRAGTYPGKNFGWVDRELIQAFHLAANANGLQNIIEILDYSEESLEFILPYADCVQVGTRQMQNYTLLRKLGACGKPVLLKRNVGATIDEWLGAAEYVLKSGCKELYLIERGSSTNATHVRWDLSISMIPAVQALSAIPIICDASHGTGRSDLVVPMALAGVAAGANGILVEVHQDPKNSLSDADQAIPPEAFRYLMTKALVIREIIRGI